jgi:hypothetical protein
MIEKLELPAEQIGGSFCVGYPWGVGPMYFSEIAIMIFSATLLGILFWATIGPPPAEEQFSVASRHSIEHWLKP